VDSLITVYKKFKEVESIYSLFVLDFVVEGRIDCFKFLESKRKQIAIVETAVFGKLSDCQVKIFLGNHQFDAFFKSICIDPP
jgi:hypothetical protein